MKRFMYLFFVILAVNVWGNTQTGVEIGDTYPEIEKMDSLIVVNDTTAIRNICENITRLDRALRNHSLETEYIHSAIDNFNAYVVKIFSDSDIGSYNSNIDTITPFDYLYDENLEKRFIRNRDKKIGDMSSSEHVVAMHYLLMLFQPIDYLMLLKAQNRMEGIDDDIIGE